MSSAVIPSCNFRPRELSSQILHFLDFFSLFVCVCVFVCPYQRRITIAPSLQEGGLVISFEMNATRQGNFKTWGIIGSVQVLKSLQINYKGIPSDK